MKPLHDPIIDRSSRQKQIRINKLSAELHTYGFSVVSTAWLRSLDRTDTEALEEIA